MWYTGSPCELQQRRSAHTYVVHGGQNAHMGLDLSVTRDPSFCRAELRGLQAGCIDDLDSRGRPDVTACTCSEKPLPGGPRTANKKRVRVVARARA